MFKLPRPVEGENGFTQIELLVVVLIIGILAAIAIPSFIIQKDKASAAQAKELARTAQTSAEAIATDNNGSYATISGPSSLSAIEKSIPTAVSTTNAYLSAATGASQTYSVTATAEPSGTKFTIARDAASTISRSCSPTSSGGCPSSGSW